MLSINGKLRTTSKIDESINYQGHYIEISYDQYLLFKDKSETKEFQRSEADTVTGSMNSNMMLIDNKANYERFKLRDESNLERLKEGIRINSNKEAIEKADNKADIIRREPEGVETKNITKRIDVADSGDFNFQIENTAKEISSTFLVRVFAPDGEELHRDNYSLKSLFPTEANSAIEEDESKPFLIYVEPKKYFEIEKSDDPFLGQKAKLSGRVVRVDGEEIGTTLQVILWASKSELKTFNRTDFTAVLVTTTDKKGYFFGPYPKGTYKTAFGGVSAGKTAPVPVKLREDGTFPEHVILAFDELDLQNEDDEDCSCAPETPRLPDSDDMLNSPDSFSEDIGGGKCVNFTIPNRTLEEYNYFKVVRTTEPQIKGTTIEDDDKEIPSNIWSVLVGLLGKTQANNGLSVLYPEMHALNTSRMMKASTGTSNAPNIVNSLNSFAAQSDLSVKDFKNLSKDPDGFTPRNLMVAERAATFKKAKTLLHLFNKDYGGRDWLTAKNPVDWDEEPTFYQATTIAHGHLLRFKQIWKSDGYSLGDLLYSLPLAPCQKKQIAVFDWDRSETGFRAEAGQQFEALNAYLSRDRDINEIITSSFDESVRGGSRATTKASGGGIGGGIGGLIGKFFLGVAGGYAASKGTSSSSAWQNSSRDFSSSSMNQLRDSVMQGASAVRNQRSTVIQQVRQGENLQVQTEVVGNYNHCHAVTPPR